MFKKTYIKLVIITTILMTIFTVYVILSTNFQGHFRILIFQNNENIVSHCDIIATNVLLHEKKLRKTNKSFITNEFGCYKKLHLIISKNIKNKDTIVINFKDIIDGKTIISQQEIISLDSNHTKIPIKKIQRGVIEKTKSILIGSFSVFTSRIILLLFILYYLSRLIWNQRPTSN